MRLIISVFNKIENVYLFWRHNGEVVALINQINRETEVLVTNNEAFQIYVAAAAARKVEGDFAEVGVYKGGTARFICEAKRDKVLHLFDTFEGLPERTAEDEFLEVGQFAADIDEVKSFLKSYKKVYFYKGLFPETSVPVKNKRFAFVHLDVDFYKSTLDSLEFFYPRMSKGGIILSHDYSTLPGIKKAFDKFFSDKKEIIIPLSTNQCLVFKL